jgi:hypothetical protein
MFRGEPAKIAPASSFAASSETPSLRRPLTVSVRRCRSVSSPMPATPSSCEARLSGMKKDGRARSKSPEKASGTIPTTSNVRPFSRTLRPTIEASLPKVRIQ